MDYYSHKAVTNAEYDEMMRDQRRALNSIRVSMTRANMIAGLKELHTVKGISTASYIDTLASILEREGIDIRAHLIRTREEA